MIFCVEDDPSIREIELYTLNSTGFTAKGFENAESLFDVLDTERPELILLDVMLPGMDGFEALQRLKASPATEDIPVIMATAKGAEFDKVQSLDCGADDYLVKPFGMMEMVSRIRAVLRRTGLERARISLSAGALAMDTESHRVTVDGKEITLTYKEYELLKLFLLNPGKVFTRDQLLSQIWNAPYEGETRTVDVHIRTLRKKLGACGEKIETVRNVGYRFER